jgi:hypothetical protein
LNAEIPDLSPGSEPNETNPPVDSQQPDDGPHYPRNFVPTQDGSGNFGGLRGPIL